jgi:predicted alpha-1,6-mannanase (GH76 family)
MIGRRGFLAACGGAALGLAAAKADDRVQAAPARTRSIYWQLAQTTRQFTTDRLLTRWASYRRNPDETVTAAWHDASQILADAALLPDDDRAYDALLATFRFTKSFSASRNPITGYCPTANLDGTHLDTAVQYVDDNMLTGNAYMEAAQVIKSRDSAELVKAADLLAFWLLHANLWDETFGGGYWWNTTRPHKPAQSNALALQLFLRLYLGTGRAEHLGHAQRTYDWLRATLLDRDGLYASKTASSGLDRTKFAYDQAIMIEAELMLHRATQHATRATHLDRAQHLAAALKSRLWDPIFGGVLMSTGQPLARSPVFCGWVTQSLVQLYEADRNDAWLDDAQANVDILNLFLRDPTSGGYFSECRADGGNRSTLQQCVDQSWMQRTQALLSRYRGGGG